MTDTQCSWPAHTQNVVLGSKLSLAVVHSSILVGTAGASEALLGPIDYQLAERVKVKYQMVDCVLSLVVVLPALSFLIALRGHRVATPLLLLQRPVFTNRQTGPLATPSHTLAN